jgi:sensor histidine kinase YesM
MNNPPAKREHFHPMEIIPFFRRWPQSFARDMIYTFLWSCLFGVIFYAMGAFTGGAMPSLRAFGIYVLISNIVGYSIHGLFDLGSTLRLDVLARRSGFIAKVIYFTAVPLLGVLLGLWLASFIFDVGLGRIFTDPKALLSIVSISLVISTALCVVFFWRERGAVAEAVLARERERVERIERESVSANLRALQAQIEPHFLFNTLANVTSLIDSDPAKAKHMLESFIRFLRASLAATRTESTTIAAEADLITSYLEVLRVRMGARLRGNVEVDSTLRSYALPPMLLQPIVENAIRHGLESKLEGGEIRVVARRESEKVAIDVIDTGVGFGSATTGGLGLTNIRERLKLLYGEAASLEIRDHAPSGTVVTLRLPP